MFFLQQGIGAGEFLLQGFPVGEGVGGGGIPFLRSGEGVGSGSDVGGFGDSEKGGESDGNATEGFVFAGEIGEAEEGGAFVAGDGLR